VRIDSEPAGLLSRGGKRPRIEMDHIRAGAEAKSRPARRRVARRGTGVRYEIVCSLTGDAPVLRRHCAPLHRSGGNRADAERVARALDIPRKLRPVEARSVWGLGVRSQTRTGYALCAYFQTACCS
jgi:hypothetical protein